MNEGKIIGTLTPLDNRIVGTASSNEGNISGEISIPKIVMENNYNLLENKPQIEGIELVGNKTFEELTLVSITNAELENLTRL